MLRRLLIVMLGTLAACSTPSPYTGEPFAQSHKVNVRRVSPTPEELEAQPAPRYEDVLRRDEERRERLEVPRDIHENTLWLDRSSAATRKKIGSSRYDPWESYEADRQRVLVRDWADTGKHAPIEPVVKKERPVENDPFAPTPKVTKKKAEGEGETPSGDAPADGEKKPDSE